MRKPVKRGTTEYGYILTPPEGMPGPIAAYIYENGDRARDKALGSDFIREEDARAAIFAYVDAQKSQKKGHTSDTEQGTQP